MKGKILFLMCICAFIVLSSCDSDPGGGDPDTTIKARWAKVVNHRSNDRNNQGELLRVAVASDGSIYAVGEISYISSHSTTLDFGNGITARNGSCDSRLVIVKYNSSGVAQWARTVSNTGYCGGSSFYDVAVSSDGKWVFAVGRIRKDNTYNFGNNVTVEAEGYSSVIVKYSSSGVAQWARAKVPDGNDESNFNFRSVSLASDGSIYAVGKVYKTDEINFGNDVKVKGSVIDKNNILIVKYNSAGEAQWAQSTISGTNDSIFVGVSVSSDGSVYAVGNKLGTDDMDFGNGITVKGSATITYGRNILIVKYNNEGVPQWARSMKSGGNHSMYKSVSASSDGSVYAAGYIRGDNQFKLEDDVSLSGSNDGENVLLVKYNSSGAIQWAQTSVSGNSDTVFNAVFVSQDGSIFAAGEIEGSADHTFGNDISATGACDNRRNILLIQYKDDGTAQWIHTTKVAQSLSKFYGLAIGSDKSIYGVGAMWGTENYDFGNSVTATGNSNSNILLLKYK